MEFVEKPGVPMKGRKITVGPRFASPINSPAWEWTDDTQYLQVTKGCSHNSCRFCTFYKDVPYDKVPLDEIEYYIEYLELCDKKIPIHRVFLQASNAMHLSYDELMVIGELLHKHLPHLQSIGGYGRMSDLRDKTVDQLRSLYETGFSDFYFGVETADDKLLRFMNKGYTSAELYEAGAKLHESGMPWRIGVMFGLGGKGYGNENAVKTAEFCNETEPNVIGAVSMTLVYDVYTHMFPPLKYAVDRGEFIEADEIERYEELLAFIENLTAETFFSNHHSTWPVGFSARLPLQKDLLIERVKDVIANNDERTLRAFRASVKEV